MEFAERVAFAEYLAGFYGLSFFLRQWLAYLFGKPRKIQTNKYATENSYLNRRMSLHRNS
jgi:hypothetical protein